MLLDHRPETHLHHLRRLHGGKDRGDTAMDFQIRRLAARGLENHYFLDQLPDDVDEGLLRRCIGMITREVDGRVQDCLHGLGVYLLAELPQTVFITHFRLVVFCPCEDILEFFFLFLKFVEHVVQS
uniref:Uncharacterized protein n=1 Tax=Agrobacterium albertimagni TaxID=147266 RepID=A0A7C1SK20_9HYPH